MQMLRLENLSERLSFGISVSNLLRIELPVFISAPTETEHYSK
jgi:hypothetical protein